MFVYPHEDLGEEKVISFAINPTDDFRISLDENIAKLKGSGVKKSIFYKILSESASRKIDYMVSVLFVDQAVVNSIGKQLKSGSDMVLHWVPRGYASCLALSLDKKSLVVDVRDEHTKLFYISDNDITFARRSNFSRQFMTRHLRDARYTDNQINNILSMDFSFQNNQKNFPLPVEFCLDFFLSDIKRSVQYLSSLEEEGVEQVVLLQDAFIKNGLDKWLKSSLDLPVVRGNNTLLTKMLLKSSPAVAKNPDVKDVWITAATSIIEEESSSYLPFGNQKKHRKKGTKKGGRFSAFAHNLSSQFLGVLLLICITFFGLNQYVSHLHHQSLSSLMNVKNRLSKVKSEYADSETKLIALYEKLKYYETLSDTRKFQKKLTEALGYVYLLRPTSMTIKSTNVIITKRKIRVVGSVRNILKVDAFIERLSRKSIYKNITLNRLQSKNSGITQFSLELEI